MSDAEAQLAAGRVGRAHGLDGSFYVTGPVSRLLTLGASVEVGGRSSEIVRRSGTEQRPIVRLDGIEDRADAEALRGQTLTVHAAQAPQLGEGEWWAHELEGCEVCADGRALGKVVRLIELPSCETLEVRPAGQGAPLLVPMVRDAIREIDVSRRRIEVDADFLDLPQEGAEGNDGA
ncbi:MAG TPA: ribosome maturation factor RimM [Solirubrobacteraceae bacterium]|nr:ribosome maturation factor RimM [Solirubrobacteraceae bacterium]